ncbi:AI-2E family transporter [uncultured Alistipes sp.]|uniref:AI-2E family transporter n=1 Tax=uncultured Alistipes sp. TaxID=538949 RepID=UPI0028042A3C|nr:AI-2E family transporter [uncultured Alistipes sp.]
MAITQQTLLKFVVGAAITAAVLFLVWYFSSIVVYILVSAVLAVMGNPLVKRLACIRIRGWQVPRWLAALVTLVVIWVVLAVLCTLFVPLVFHKIQQLSGIDFAAVMGSIEEPVARMQYYLDELFALPESSFSLSESLSAGLRSFVNLESLNTLFSSLFNIVLSSVVAIFSISFITFFFLKDEGLFYAMVSAMFPERYHENIIRALDSVTALLARYFTGILSESLLLTIAVLLVMMAFGMKTADACFIGLIMGVMNVVPYAGPLIGGIMAVCIGVITPIEGTSVGHTVLVIVASLLVLKGLDDFVLQPTLYSERVKAHPLEVFIVILIAGSVAGILGMLLAIPSYTVLRVFAKEFFSQFSLVRKLTEKI